MLHKMADNIMKMLKALTKAHPKYLLLYFKINQDSLFYSKAETTLKEYTFRVLIYKQIGTQVS